MPTSTKEKWHADGDKVRDPIGRTIAVAARAGMASQIVDEHDAAIAREERMQDPPWWPEHTHWTREDWRQEVREDNTLLGYQDWVEHQIESKKNDES